TAAGLRAIGEISAHTAWEAAWTGRRGRAGEPRIAAHSNACLPIEDDTSRDGYAAGGQPNDGAVADTRRRHDQRHAGCNVDSGEVVHVFIRAIDGRPVRAE